MIQADINIRAYVVFYFGYLFHRLVLAVEFGYVLGGLVVHETILVNKRIHEISIYPSHLILKLSNLFLMKVFINWFLHF